jgi:hypothetical protein
VRFVDAALERSNASSDAPLDAPRALHVPRAHFYQLVHPSPRVHSFDGVTGGYNFLSAWATSWCAGTAIAEDARQLVVE